MTRLKRWLQTWQRVPYVAFALLSIGASVVTVGLKFYAYRLTGSVGLLSDAVESVVNVVAALTALFALWYASFPADRGHPYGHEKIEFFASGVEGGLIFVAALTIAGTALSRLFKPTMPEALNTGVAVLLVSTAINFAVGRVLLVTGQREESIVLEADGRHLLADVWTSVGVVIGLVLVALTKRAWLDPLIALLVGINIARIGLDLLHRSFDGLMDRALADEEVAKIRGVIEATLEPGMTYHALRTRRAGAQRFVDFHLLVPGQRSVAQAHDFEMMIEQAIIEVIPRAEITTHIEPIEEPRAWNDSALTEEAEAMPPVGVTTLL